MSLFSSIVPESPRWNSAHGRFHKAKPVLEKMARINGRSLPADIDSSLEAFIEEVINPYPAKLIYSNVQPLKVVSRHREPQPQVVANYSYWFNLRPNIYTYWLEGVLCA